MLRRYKKRSHISDSKIREIVWHFSRDLTATQTSEFTEISRPTINRYFNHFRTLILQANTGNKSLSNGTFELDESYFGARRVRGKRGRGAAGKTPVFGLLKRDNNQVFVSIVENCSQEQLMPIIEGKILSESTVYTDGWKAYDSLILNGYDHYRIHHSKNEFARGKQHVNGIESFWSYAKRRLSKFNGLSDDKFVLHLKECEFRWNHKKDKVYEILLSLLRKDVKGIEKK